jgi:hypothetical protein
MYRPDAEDKMNVDSIRKVPLSLTLALCVALLAGLAPSRAMAQGAGDDWQFSATVYGWFPDIGGQTRFPAGAGGDIDVDISTILDHLKMTAQGSFEVHKGSWGAFTDIVYLDVGEARSQTRNLEFGGIPLPAAVTADVDFDLKSIFWTLAASYRVKDASGSVIDVLFGARLATFKQTLDWDFSGSFGPVTPPPASGTRAADVDQWDAIVGVKGRFSFGPEGHWTIPYYLDVGTGDSELTWQGMLGVAYTFGWGDLGVAWRYLDYDLGSEGPITDMNFNGPALGATFRW